MAPAAVSAPWRPLFVRGALAAAFGLLTVFWQQPNGAPAGWAAAAYLLGTAGSLIWLRSALPGRVAARAGMLRTAGFFLLAAIVFALPLGPDRHGWIGGAAVLAAGLSELVLGRRGPAETPLARDGITNGVISAGAGVLLIFVAPLGYKAVMGVLGGSAVILAVLLVLAGLSYRHDADRGSRT
ncbi:MAG: hypothetical protein JWO93_2476 [Micrococcaceae bacterium]|jgi:hypothetical protein|nr:hypothetical protein [Micrococcaceae bacterium]